MPEIRCETRADKPGVLTIVLDNRPALNALTTQMQIDLVAALNRAREDKSVRVVLIRGAGSRAFSAGGAMECLDEITDEASAEAMYRRGCAVREAISAMDKPVIAAVSGFCIGAGFEIAMCCDMIYASDDARFGLPESNLGLVPGWGGAIRLPRKVTVNKAKEMILLGEQMPAEEAYRLCIVNKIFPKEDLFEAVDRVIDRLLERAPLAIRGVKAIVSHAIVDGNIEAAQEVEKKLSIYLMSTDDFKEAISAFREKRKPKFHGK